MDVTAFKNRVPTSPAFLLDEREIIATLEILDQLRQESGCKVLYSIKSLPFSTVLEWIKPGVDGFSVSSLFEARLADEVLSGCGSLHLTTPGLKKEEIGELSRLCNYISFNSLSQYRELVPQLTANASPGLRINPKLSFSDDLRYDPCRPHSKLGVAVQEINALQLPEFIQGLHFHTVFSSRSFNPLIETVDHLQSQLGAGFASLKWLNFGGGYLFNKEDDHSGFTRLVRKLKQDYGFEIFVEPGKAITGNAGYLMATVIDCFISDGKAIAVLDTSVNHNPEVFEYQRKPLLAEEDPEGEYTAILAGSTCLAGDLFGEYQLNKPLQIGDRVVFKRVGAYSLPKASRFNGYNLPDIYAVRGDKLKLLKRYTYQDYRSQWWCI